VLLVLHGINGGSHESYCRAICHAAVTRRGWRAVVLNYRGCNGLPLTSPRGYAATLTPDVHVAVEAVRARLPPGTPLLTVGYSLGGILLTKYLAELCLGLHATPDGPSGNNVISAAAVVSSPICLANSGATLGRPWTPGYIYNLALAHKLREYISHHRGELSGAQSGVVSLDAALAQRTVGRMEDEGRLPAAFGFASRAAYHEAASSLPLIPAITSPPTLFLVSRDDPFLGVLPDAECAANPSTLLAATSHGGHVAFLRGWAPLSLELEASWMDDVVLQFLAAVMDARREAAEVDGVETRTGPVGCKPVEGLGAPDAHMTPNWNGDSAAVLTQEDGSHSSAHVPVGQLPRSAVTWLDLDEARLPWRGGEEGLRPPQAAPRSRL
jgi:abhydrolase domain-containing protein 1/3